MGPTWGPSGANRTQVGPMLAPWTLLSEDIIFSHMRSKFYRCYLKTGQSFHTYCSSTSISSKRISNNKFKIIHYARKGYKICINCANLTMQIIGLSNVTELQKYCYLLSYMEYHWNHWNFWLYWCSMNITWYILSLYWTKIALRCNKAHVT